MNEIIVATCTIGCIGLCIGIVLSLASEKLKVEVDEKEIQVRECLPGNNCGACGYPGCDGLASAIAKDEAPINQCPVGGATVAKMIGSIMGKEASLDTIRETAYVRCKGTCDQSHSQYYYYGIKDCQSATVIPGAGDKACSWGCIGYGSCVQVCEFDAIHVNDGVAIVDKDKCKACGKCLKVCPNHLIEMVPYDALHRVRCHSQDKALVTRKGCEAGCIGCSLCTRVCPNEAITITNNLAHIDYNKCSGCGLCAQKCPRHIIE